MRLLKILFVFIIVVFFIIAGIQNIAPLTDQTLTLGINLHFVNPWKITFPLGFVIPVCFVAGFFTMFLIDFFFVIGMKRRVKQLEKELKTYRPADALQNYSDEYSAEKKDNNEENLES